MNREDILSAKERFGQMRRQPTVSTSRSYDGLSVRERKLEKARNFGVKLVPTFVAPSPPIDPVRRSVHKKLRGTNYTEGADASSQQEDVVASRDGESYHPSQVASNIPTPVRTGASNRTTSRGGESYYRSQRADGGGNSVVVHQSYSHNAISQVSVQYNQEFQGRADGTHYRSQADTGGSTAAAVYTGNSAREQADQQVLDKEKKATASPSPKVAAKPTKSSRLAMFASRKKKVSANYEAIVASKEKEKTTSRFKLKLPFGKGRVKELMAKIEPQAEKTDARRQTVSKASKQSPSVSPKHYFPPPKEPAPPPPREPVLQEPTTRQQAPREQAPRELAPPPPNEVSNVTGYHRRPVSSRPSVESSVPMYRQRPVAKKSSVESGIPLPSYHRRTSDVHVSSTGTNVPSFYQGASHSSEPSMAQRFPSYLKGTTSEANISSYQKKKPLNKPVSPRKQVSPKHEDHLSSSKLPAPAPKTYYRQLLPRAPKATLAEAAVVNSQMSLYKVQPYLVPIRTQPPPEVVYIPGPNEEKHNSPKSEAPPHKIPPPAVVSTMQCQPQLANEPSTPATASQQVSNSELAATSSISKSNMSLDSIIEECVGASPSPSTAQPPTSSESTNSFTKDRERRPSFVRVPSTTELASQHQVETPNSRGSEASSTYTGRPAHQNLSKRSKHSPAYTSKLPTYQSSTYTSRLPTPAGSAIKPTYQSSTFSKKSTSTISSKAPPVSSSSLSLDSILTDMENSRKGLPSNSNSPFRSQLPPEKVSSSGTEDLSSSKAASSRPNFSTTNRSFAAESRAISRDSMSLDSILDEFLKLSGSDNNQAEAAQKPQFSTKDVEETSVGHTSSHQELQQKDKENGSLSKSQHHDKRQSVTSALNGKQQLNEDSDQKSPKLTPEIEYRERQSLFRQESASTSQQDIRDKGDGTISRQLPQGHKEQRNPDYSSGQVYSRQPRSNEKREPTNSKPIPQARKLYRQEVQQVNLRSGTINRQPAKVKDSKGYSKPISEPLRLQRREDLQSNPDLTSCTPMMSMSQNLVKLKVRANSAGTILDGEAEYSDPRDAKRTSNISNISNLSNGGPTSPKVATHCLRDAVGIQ